MSTHAGKDSKQILKGMKKPISATIEEELIEWIAEQCENKVKYRNKSHLIEIALATLRQKEDKK